MDNFFTSIVKIEPPFNMIVLVVLFGTVASAIAAVVKQVRLYSVHRAETQLKRELVERGLSVDEIERILSAKSASSSVADGN